jgi:hypothetical protein
MGREQHRELLSLKRIYYPLIVPKMGITKASEESMGGWKYGSERIEI